MFKSKQVITKVVASALLTMAFAAPTMASYQSYQGYKLPIFSGNNYTNLHDKETADDYIKNKVDQFKDTSKANFWAIDGNEDAISDEYAQKANSTATKIYFLDDINLDKEDQVGMGMENYYVEATVTAFVAGEVDFR